MIRSISSGGQPWKVESVSVSDNCVRNSRSRYCRYSSGICARSRSTTSVQSFMPRMNACTRSDWMPFRS